MASHNDPGVALAERRSNVFAFFDEHASQVSFYTTGSYEFSSVATSAGWSGAILFENDGESAHDSLVFERYYQAEVPRDTRVAQTNSDLIGSVVDITSDLLIIPRRQGDVSFDLSRFEQIKWVIPGENEDHRYDLRRCDVNLRPYPLTEAQQVVADTLSDMRQ